MDTKHGPNRWLISNSSLYFSNNLVNKGQKVNPYSLFDLSKVSEAILLSEQIITLPGNNNNDNELFNFLKDNDLVEVINISTSNLRQDVHGVSRGQDALFYPRSIQNDENRDKLSQILCDTFGIESKDKVKNFIGNLSEWTDKNWQTPDYEANKWLMDKLIAEDTHWDMFRNAKENDANDYIRNFDIVNFPALGDMIAEVYLRSVLYLLVAADQGLTYFPDSIRAPIASSLHRLIETEIVNFVQMKIQKLEEHDKKLKEELNRLMTFSKYDIKIPACLSYILKNDDSNKKFLENSLRLRNSKEIRRFREFLTKCEIAIRDEKDDKIRKELKKLEDILPSQSFRQTLTATKVGENIPQSETDLIRLAIKLGSHIKNYFGNRRIIFYKNLLDEISQIKSINSLLQQKFRSSLSKERLDYYNRLAAYQERYLKAHQKE